MKITTKVKRMRSSNGSCLVELAASLPIMVAVLAISLNGMFGLMASMGLDSTCADAARAASLAPDIQIAQRRAEVSASRQIVGVSKPKVTVIEFQDYKGDYQKDPYLVVKAECKYTLPFPILGVDPRSNSAQEIKLYRFYAYPILTLRRPDDPGNGADPDPGIDGGPQAAAAAAPASRALPPIIIRPKAPPIPDESGAS